MADFTDETAVMAFLSSFWSKVFPDRGLPQGQAAGASSRLSQLYMDTVGTFNSVTPGSIPVLREELVTPLVMRESEMSLGPDSVQFGEGAVFGEQTTGDTFTQGDIIEYGGEERRAPHFYFPLPAGVLYTGATVVNRLFNPSRVFLEDVDFIPIGEEIIAFKDNPFEDELLPSREVDGDREIVVWMINTQVDKNDIWRHFTAPFLPQKKSTTALKAVAEGIHRLYPGGPSIGIVDSFVAAAAGLPMTVEREVVEKVDNFDGHDVVVTDLNVYQLPDGHTMREDIVEGAALEPGTPLSEATTVVDFLSDPGWWEDVGSMTLSPRFVSPSITPDPLLAADEEATVEIVGQSDGGKQLIRFPLHGDEDSKASYWAWVDSNADRFDLAGAIWTHLGLVDGDGDPDYAETPVINPLGFLVERCFQNSIVVARVALDQIGSPSQFLRNMQLLADAWAKPFALVLLIDYDIAEGYTFENGSNVSEETAIHHGFDLVMEDFVTGDRVAEHVEFKPVKAC